MTQEPRTTESENRDNAAIRDIMHRVKELTVPDRATLALGIIGHLATMMNGRQMEKLLAQLVEEAAKVQDVPPSRQSGGASRGGASLQGGRSSQADASPQGDASPRSSVGQAGRGAVSEDNSGLL